MTSITDYSHMDGREGCHNGRLRFFKHQQPADNTDSKVRTDLALGNRRRHAHRIQTTQDG